MSKIEELLIVETNVRLSSGTQNTTRLSDQEYEELRALLAEQKAWREKEQKLRKQAKEWDKKVNSQCAEECLAILNGRAG